MRQELNDIVRVWTNTGGGGGGDVQASSPLPWEMGVDAFVNVTNERLQAVDPSAVTVFYAAARGGGGRNGAERE